MLSRLSVVVVSQFAYLLVDIVVGYVNRGRSSTNRSSAAVNTPFLFTLGGMRVGVKWADVATTTTQSSNLNLNVYYCVGEGRTGDMEGSVCWCDGGAGASFQDAGKSMRTESACSGLD